MKSNKFTFSDPVTLSGEGQYNLNSLKMIDVTESFLELDENVIKCQDKVFFDNCTTKYYLEIIKKKCECLPVLINTLEEVHMLHVICYIAISHCTSSRPWTFFCHKRSDHAKNFV